jgi:hypothetical protein
MSSKQIQCQANTKKNAQCKNSVKINGLCTVHYNEKKKHDDKIRLENMEKEQKIIEKQINEDYNELCIFLSIFGFNLPLVRIMLTYITDIFADSSWRFSGYNDAYMTFCADGSIIYCRCSHCGSSDCCKKGNCEHRIKNYKNKHCVYCTCSDCICEAANIDEFSSDIMPAELGLDNHDYDISKFCVNCEKYNTQSKSPY